MKPGRGRGKGHGFEIDISKRLSLWITGRDKDPCLWRSAGSGSFNKITSVTNLKSDIQAIKEEGYPLMDKVAIECKCYKIIDVLGKIDRKKTIVEEWWEQVRDDAGDTHHPLLIMRRNNGKAILVGREALFKKFTEKMDTIRMYVLGEPVILVPLEEVLTNVNHTEFLTYL